MIYEKFGMKITQKHLAGQFCREERHPAFEYFQDFVDTYRGIFEKKKKKKWRHWESNLSDGKITVNFLYVFSKGFIRGLCLTVGTHANCVAT